MCLNVNSGAKEGIAKADICCYKVCIIKDSKFYTYFRREFVEIGNTYTSELMKYHTSVEMGLHSFFSYEGAKKFLTSRNELNSFNPYTSIIKATIPKGSRFYLGKFSGLWSYASSCIIYERTYFGENNK